MSEEQVDQPGWDAIDDALEKVYGDQEPKHYRPLISYILGGNDPLDGISVYTAKEPARHWHFVTYGFSELYEKELEDKQTSGFGFELTFRLLKEEGEKEPPAWASNLLQNLARYVFNSGNVFKNGDYLDANGPICQDADTALTALAFIIDPDLPEIETVHGKMEFIQLVGTTAEELEAMQIWNTIGVLHAGSKHMPKYMTDLNRRTILDDTQVTEAIREGSEKEGSSTGFLFLDQADWQPMKKGIFKRQPARVSFGAKQASMLAKIIRGRKIKGDELRLVSKEVTIIVSFAEKAQVIEEASGVKLMLDEAAVEALEAELGPVEKEFSLPSLPDVIFDIVKTEIKDPQGNIVETIG